MKVYKIYNVKTGEFRTGNFGWSRHGKMWIAIGHLKSHLTTNKRWYKNNKNDIRILEFELVQGAVQNLEDLKPDWFKNKDDK